MGLQCSGSSTDRSKLAITDTASSLRSRGLERIGCMQVDVAKGHERREGSHDAMALLVGHSVRGDRDFGGCTDGMQDAVPAPVACRGPTAVTAAITGVCHLQRGEAMGGTVSVDTCRPARSGILPCHAQGRNPSDSNGLWFVRYIEGQLAWRRCAERRGWIQRYCGAQTVSPLQNACRRSYSASTSRRFCQSS